MFHKKSRGGRKGRKSGSSRRYQPHHSAGKPYVPEERDELIQPLDTGTMEALVDKNEHVAHPTSADPFEPASTYDDGVSDEGQPADGQEGEAFPEQAAAVVSEPERETAVAEGWQSLWEDADLEEAPAAAFAQDVEGEPADFAAAVDAPPHDGDSFSVREQETEQAADVSPVELSRYRRGDMRYTQHRARKSRKRKLLVGVLACVIAVFGVFGGLAFAWWQSTAGNITLDDRDITDQLSEGVSDEPFWMLILGSDSRDNSQSGSRSDVILLARVDQPNKQVTLVSIPRDTKVTIDGQTMKINAAYGLGGAAQAIETVEEYAGVDIAHYAEIYFDGFEDLVDQLGGVTVDVPERASYAGITIEPGVQTLDGREALTLARNRKTYADGDFTRTECQRLLVQALVSKVLEQDVSQLPATINAISYCFKTDLDLQDLISLATSMQGMGSDSIYMAMAPSTTGMIGNASYTFTYIDQWKLLMQRADSGEDPTLTDEEIEICGDASTQDVDLDMTVPLDEETLARLQEYWTGQTEEALAEQEQQAVEGSEQQPSGSVQ